MIVLRQNEYISRRSEAKIVIKKKDPEKEKYNTHKEGKGIIYVTSERIIFEDNLQGIIFQLGKDNISSYRIIEEFPNKKIRINFAVDKNSVNGLADITCKDCSELMESIDSFLSQSNNTFNKLLVNSI